MADWRKQARELCEAATEGPWELDSCGSLRTDGKREPAVWIDGIWYVLKDGPAAKGNAKFIAQSRTLLPRALDELDRQDKVIAALEGMVGHDWGCDARRILCTPADGCVGCDEKRAAGLKCTCTRPARIAAAAKLCERPRCRKWSPQECADQIRSQLADDDKPEEE